ncbi:P-loop containing nucleoside triphosphate hydrolase protein [Roridomyces roridus]|uniref:P-loop containing nucleoside triphosphate hydrolase protein n=1 Tax=Roridomyces roridus TaxID=1738132 RepID=A0AAD7FXS1_9AGAR|nr:P-loop containing nucleoside triphosphate hydrolase protein [Roridomyces roridus]
MDLAVQVAWVPANYEQNVLAFDASPAPVAHLSTVVFSVAVILLLARTVANLRSPRCLAWKLDLLVAPKVVFGVVNVAGVSSMLFHAVKGRDAKSVVLVGAAVQLAAAISFLFASVSEHYHSIAPSTPTTLYAIFGCVFYAYNLQPLDAVSLFILIFLECKSKRSLLLPMDPPPAYESTLSFLAKPFFPHIVPLLYIGSKRPIKLPELSDIPTYLQADPATEKLMAALATGDKTNPRYLINSTFRAMGGNFLSPVLPRLLVLAGTFAQVTLVEQMILYVSDQSIPAERGPILVAAFFAIYIALPIAEYAYTENLNAFVVLYGSALTGSLYTKTLALTSAAAREVGQGAVTTYMSVDVEKVTGGFVTFQELWAAIVTIFVACGMLWVKAGWMVMAAPLLFIVALISATSTVGSFVAPAQKAWLAAIDNRIKLLTSVLSQLLPIKLGAYEPALATKINGLRAAETHALKRFMYLISGAATMSNIGSTGSFFVTLLAYYAVRLYGWADLPPLDVSRIFTLLTIVNILSGPLNMIGQRLPALFASYASVLRIQSFLQLPEKERTEHPEEQEVLVDVSEAPTNQVSLKDCTFGWDDKSEVLHEINLELQKGELTMVVGSVASGKSSLLMSLLGETRREKGLFSVKARRIALASQTPFIYPGLCAPVEYILLDSAWDEEFYNKVIHACGLRQDIDALPKGDLVKLGDRGATLSGGQRQRVAIARAVYARADLVLLDDVFSALDGETEAHVFASLFGSEGLLKGQTTVLVTHGIHHLPDAAKVIVMEAGTISHFGTFEQVRDSGATFALASNGGKSNGHGNGNGHAAVQKPGGGAVAAEVTTVVDEEKEEEKAWNTERASRRGAYTFYAKCTGYGHSAVVIGVITVSSTVGLFATGYLSMLASSSGSHLGLWIAGYGGIVLLNLLSLALLLLSFAYVVSTQTAPNIHKVELAGVLRAPISWITSNPTGTILNRFSQDMQVADREFPFAFLNFAANLLGMIGTFVFIAIATPLVALALPVLGVLGYYGVTYYLITSKQFRRLELESKSPLYTLFGTTVSGLITVRAYRAEGYFRTQNSLFINASQGALHYRLAGQLFLRIFLLWFQAILACTVAVLTVSMRGGTSAALLGVALTRLVGLGQTLTHILNSYASVENGSIAIDRIEEYAKLPEEEKLFVSDEVVLKDLSAWPSAGHLTFSDFSMRYRDNLPLALKNLTFDLEGGQKIGICGRTGSGKSSTVLSLFRGIDQHLVSGSITIDGVDISTLPLKILRESMSIVTQDPFLWHGSIRENLDINNERSDVEIWDALKLVEMYDSVSGLDDKLDHLVVDEESFSKGQRQLLCLARALLRNKKVIVLDESTSSMDHITDEKIRHVVDSKMKGFTVIAIAHRICQFLILVLDNGSIVEFDSPKSLLANPESRFARLAATQGIYHPDFVPNGAAVEGLSDGAAVVVAKDLVDV